MRRFAMLAVLFATVVLPARGADPREKLADSKLEERARNLSAGLRCMVCRNQSIDESDADLARDLRWLVRDRLSQGDSDEQVREYLVSRYGEFVLLKPRLRGETLLLWAMPFLLLAAFTLWLTTTARKRRRSQRGRPLTLEEEARLHGILAEHPPSAKAAGTQLDLNQRPIGIRNAEVRHEA